jgi:hypothetical protein
VIRALVVSKHPFMAFAERSILVVPVFERRLYALESDELTPERVLSLARACEQEILGMSPAPRPLLTLPHLVSMESACSYQGYLLAHMAVYQARAFFLERDGFIADNGRVGPELAERCWAPGNSVSHAEAVRRLVGEGPSGRELADVCNQSTDDFWAGHARRMAASAHRPAPPESSPYELDAHLRIVHGAETIATNERGIRGVHRAQLPTLTGAGSAREALPRLGQWTAEEALGAGAVEQGECEMAGERIDAALHEAHRHTDDPRRLLLDLAAT